MPARAGTTNAKPCTKAGLTEHWFHRSASASLEPRVTESFNVSWPRCNSTSSMWSPGLVPLDQGRQFVELAQLPAVEPEQPVAGCEPSPRGSAAGDYAFDAGLASLGGKDAEERFGGQAVEVVAPDQPRPSCPRNGPAARGCCS